ncbi:MULTISPECIES: hypothetical protein [Flavobacterium]|uniref:Y-family DNA polymerase n=1 Tax=Flavobacterium TaxID=237 RepID=UPI002115762D|nr:MULTISPECIES: hypothetical protein [Flavobacterium]UUF12551.1 hypothetical protein NLJ00_14950 [Flavobacterium panici]
MSCERLSNPKLNSIPLIIGSGIRGVVASCSYRARSSAPPSAMPLHRAMKLCRQAKIMEAEMQLYCCFSHDIIKTIKKKAPVPEKPSSMSFIWIGSK